MKTYWPIAVIALALALIVAVNTAPYGYRITAPFHMDARTAEGNPLPPGFVVLEVPSYDGAQYYQVARNIPKMVNSSRWHELTEHPPGSYAYQRFLLPLVAYAASFGNVSALPLSFFFINIGAVLLTAFLLLKRYPQSWLYVLALCLSPAVIVAMHFTLAEPLTILLITAFLIRFADRGRLGLLDVLLLSLVVLAREVNILFIGFLIGYMLLKKQWRDAALLLIPAAVFMGLHGLIYEIFGNVPFLISAGARRIPGSEAFKLVSGQYGYGSHSLSAIAFCLFFFIPGLFFILKDINRTRRIELLSLGSLAFFGVLSLMPEYIWGSMSSIGRVITPVFPLFILLLRERDTPMARVIAVFTILLAAATALGLAMSIHPYTLA